MESGELIAWQMQPGQWVGVLAMGLAAASVALAIGRRAAERTHPGSWLWLVGGAFALGSGIWAIHFIALLGPQLPIGIGYGGELSLAAWCCAVIASLLVLKLAFAEPGSLAKRFAAAVLLGAGTLVCEALAFTDMRMAPAVLWNPLWAAAAVGSVVVATTAALQVQLKAPPAGKGHLIRLGAALVMGVGLALGHRFSALAAQLDMEAVSLHHLSGLTGNSLALLATVGTGGLLAVLSVLAVVEHRMRDALHHAIRTIEATSRTDALTTLPNRAAFERQLEQAAYGADRRAHSMALLFIALDDFRTVNDSFGRHIGDSLLQATARQLGEVAGRHHLLARVGGDEFALLITTSAGPETAMAMARRVIQSLSAEVDIEGRRLAACCSIGVVMYPSHGAHSTMLAHGEAATRSAKRLGGSAPVLFEPQMLGNARDQLELLRDLREALGAGQMELYYQPKIDAPSGAITGAEALLRWHHPKRGMVSPAVFIPIAERHGLIAELGNWVIDEACRQARAWRDEGLRMRVAINLSVSQLRQSDLGERIEQALHKYQINPHLLTCEITESLAMEESNTTARFFEEIARIGVHVSIDDFGTGYSSLAYLRKLPAEELKIDRSFVLDLETSADARAVVDAVVKLAQALGLRVVAEGVETEAQNQILRALGCDELQGFLFARPMSAKALGVWAMTDDGPTPLKFRDSLFQETLPAQLH